MSETQDFTGEEIVHVALYRGTGTVMCIEHEGDEYIICQSDASKFLEIPAYRDQQENVEIRGIRLLRLANLHRFVLLDEELLEITTTAIEVDVLGIALQAPAIRAQNRDSADQPAREQGG